jgi:hypothetical protein
MGNNALIVPRFEKLPVIAVMRKVPLFGVSSVVKVPEPFPAFKPSGSVWVYVQFQAMASAGVEKAREERAARLRAPTMCVGGVALYLSW